MNQEKQTTFDEVANQALEVNKESAPEATTDAVNIPFPGQPQSQSHEATLPAQGSETRNHDVQPSTSSLEEEVPSSPSFKNKIIRSIARVAGVAGAAVIVAGGVNTGEDAYAPDFEGEQTVRITNETTVTDLALNHVDGAETATGATVNEIIDRNPEVFQDGKAFIGSEDINETVKLPDSVNK